MLAALEPIDSSSPLPPSVSPSLLRNSVVPPVYSSAATSGSPALSKRASVDSSTSPLQTKKQRVETKDSFSLVSDHSSRSLRLGQGRFRNVLIDDDDDDDGRSNGHDSDYVPQPSRNLLIADDDLTVPMPDAAPQGEDGVATGPQPHPMSAEAQDASVAVAADEENEEEEEEEESEEEEEYEGEDEDALMNRYVCSDGYYVYVAC